MVQKSAQSEDVSVGHGEMIDLIIDQEILDWIDQEKPDILFRTGHGVWVLSADMDDPEMPRYEGKTIREVVRKAMLED